MLTLLPQSKQKGKPLSFLLPHYQLVVPSLPGGCRACMPQLLGWWFLSSACSLTPNTIISKYRRQAVVSAKHVSFFKPSSWSLSSWKKHLVTITKAGKILTEKQPDTNPLRDDLKLTLRNTVKHIGLHKHTYSSRRSGGNLWASVHFTDTTCSVHTFLRHWYKTQQFPRVNPIGSFRGN